MTTCFMAVFEKGLLRPLVPLPLKEGELVSVLIHEVTSANQDDNVASILANIAALPTSGGDPSTSRDHDKVLCGDHGAL
jgi:predicted DNA-binding antitoxin AbrB/MazE fold protein